MSTTHTAEWIYQPRQTLTLRWNGTTLANYHFAADRRKPFFHPVQTPSGIAITAFEPSDHVWHRGIWFAWKYLNGVNYWEESEDAAVDGRTLTIGDEHVALGPAAATVSTTLHYQPPSGDPVLEEQRTVRFGPPTDGSFIIDWEQHFRASSLPVTIDRTPINDETPWGGYAGLSWRAARTLRDFRALNSEGQRDADTEHQRARWLDLSGISDGGRNQVGGVAIFDHPKNPGAPTHWRCILDPAFGYINPAFVLKEPYTLAAGEILSLRYRMLIHQGWGEIDPLEEEFRRFSGT